MAFERITVDHAKMGGLPCFNIPAALEYAAAAVQERNLPLASGQ